MDNDSPIKAAEPTPTTAPTIDPDAVAAKAKEIAASQVEELKNNLVDSISGKKSRYGETGPKSWDDLHDSVVTDAEKRAEQLLEKKLEEREKRAEEERKSKETKTKEEIKSKQEQEWTRMTNEWKEAVADGILPGISPEVEEKLKTGTQYNDLTPEEKNDEGLKAYNEVVALHTKLAQEGKSSSLYRTAMQNYGKQPAGASAPVLGGSRPTPDNEEFSYDEVQANRKAKYGY